MIWFFVDPIWWKHAGPLLWIGNTIYGLVFIWLYLYSFSRPEPRRLYAIVAMIVMAAIANFIPQRRQLRLLIYAIAAGAFTPRLWRVLGLLIALEAAILGFYVHRQHLPWSSGRSMLLLIILVGLGNHYGAIAHCSGRKAAPGRR